MYVVAVFLDLAADSFSSEPSVAQINVWYLVVAILFGLTINRLKLKLGLGTIVSLILIIGGIVFSLNHQFLILPKQIWVWFLLAYAMIASILPVWILLQPRDYLSSFYLYFTVMIGLIGLIFGKNSITYPSFVQFKSSSIGPLVPFMFITIACGAISGFHSLVSSGTTSKQLDSPKNARFVSYGGMILEGIVAAIALGTVMILTKEQAVGSPQKIYALGIGKFCSILKINPRIGEIIGYTAISAFILTTLDTATRIARYIFQELFDKKESDLKTRVMATGLSLILPLILLNINLRDLAGNIVPVWKVIWPLFGTTNQLLAALTLLVIFVWAKREGFKNRGAVLLPMLFMVLMTLTALSYTIFIKVSNKSFDVITISAIILLALAIFVIFQSTKVLSADNKEQK